MATSQVSLTKTLTVFPKTLNPPNILELSNLDRQCPLHMYLIFFYKPSPLNKNSSLDSVFTKLKLGLEETLSIWSPAAGRLDPNPAADGKLNLRCNNRGAILGQAITNVKISELGDLSNYNEFFEKLVYKPILNHGNFSEFPLVVAQVTRFGCGGYSIGTGISHSLFDGPAAYQFLSAWAAANSTIFTKNSNNNNNKVQFLPVHERGSLINLTGSVDDANRSSGTRAVAIDHLYQLIMQNGMMGNNIVEKMGKNEYGCRTFRVSREMVEKLKKNVANGGFPCSSFDVIAAHLWKAKTKALKVSKEKMVCLQFAVDVRNKLMPPLPKGFSGNAFVLASVALTAKQLEEESYKTIVEMIQNAKSRVDNDYVNAYKQGLEGPQSSLPSLKELTVVSDWTRMPFHKIDFLYGQQEAAYASPLNPPILEVVYFLQNPTDSQAIDVRVTMLSETLDAFASYFLTRMQ